MLGEGRSVGIRAKKQKRGSRGAGWKWRWKRGGGRLGSGIIRLRETEVRPGTRTKFGQSPSC